MTSRFFQAAKWLAGAVCLAVSLQAVAGDALYLEKEKYMKKMDELKLASFNVSFMTAEGKSASTQSIDNFMGANSKLVVRTVGLENAELQKVVDAAYEDFVSKAKAAGFTVSYFDALALAPEWVSKEFKYRDNYSKDLSHYQVYSWMDDITVAATGFPLLAHKDGGLVGWAAKEQDERPITINYTIAPGYLMAKASKREDDFFNKIYNKTNVTFYPGVQVFWRSGAEIWLKKNKKGEIKIEEHIYKEVPAGKLTQNVKTDLPGRKAAELTLTVDPDLYYPHALDILKQANTKIVDAMADAR
ncbi:hypothetical protein A3724_08485 [Alcanivorax sp. HI0033]|uniref:hypothetical protein n=1 Tax=unclassified Alcanivorax TaxID=2638842 RepID=UPI0007BA37D6|nr:MULTISPECIES: hypothetical protein [unclassified Alcanivorax]KZX73882.1 hypothetical protein A3716_02215 [Alcanivorax sp. HI0011]KZX78927.1 hypothetical protein A3717_10695 [Alcanivorax sp. HI0013]KZY14784.1 hypothetical protein A3725_10260 [Alcanivorax sp. HI0035]KZX60798.1 hypothetical protein A3713_11615 [Alcanivorax sp. HI0003]KZX67526.1 hypothetical protein A3714_10440 [Alcanivorax sp. HI0007]